RDSELTASTSAVAAKLHPVSASESPGGVPLAGQRIDQIDVGQWVLAENPGEEDDTRFGLLVNPEEWRLLELRAPKADGSQADVRMLRPLWWIQQQWTERFLPKRVTLLQV